MLYTAADKLPEDFFQDMIQENAGIIRKYLKDIGNPLIFTMHTLGQMWPHSNFYSPKDEEDSL